MVVMKSERKVKDGIELIEMGTGRIAGRTTWQEILLPGRDGFTGRNPVLAGQVDFMVMKMPTRLTRHGKQ